MTRTRRTLYYLVTYLTLTGVGLMAAPQWVLKLLFSTGQYDDVFPRFSGLLLAALGVMVIQIIRHRAEALYGSTLLVRSFIWVTVAGFYWQTGDPFFLVVLGVVGAGMMMTGTAYYKDRREQRLARK